MSSSSRGPAPGEDVFGADDLAPPEWEVRAGRRMLADKVATTVAVTALGLWLGGLVALGVCAAPMVFRLTPYPFSGNAMGAAFQRFDTIAIGCGVIALGCEVVRTLLRWGERPRIAPRVRRYVAIAMALGAVYTGVRLTPSILALHRDGVRRNVGSEGAELQRLHAQAELIGKVNAPLAVLLIGLHVFTLRSGADEEDDAVAPAAPGPAGDADTR